MADRPTPVTDTGMLEIQHELPSAIPRRVFDIYWSAPDTGTGREAQDRGRGEIERTVRRESRATGKSGSVKAAIASFWITKRAWQELRASHVA